MTRGGAAASALVTALAVLLAAAAVDSWLRHGVEVTWRATHEEALVEVDRTVEHRVAFENPHRALSRYVQGWDFQAWGVPSELPPLDARVRGRLEIPEGPPLLLRARTPNQADVLVDNLRAVDPVEPGDHELEVFWHGPLQPPGTNHWTRILPASLELLWGPDEQSLVPVPREAFTLPAGVDDGARIATWIGAVLAALLLGLAVFAILRAPDLRRMRRRGAILATVLLLALGLGLRLFDYSVMPEFRENMDELFATWNGWQLLESGETVGWTLWPARYGGLAELEQVSYFRERPITVVSPYFEHPPLLHLLVGAAAHLGGAREMLHARLSHTRLVPIGLGALTLLLVVFVGRRLYPRSLAPWIAALLYATIPHLVLMNRVIKEEALLAPLALGSLLFFLRWRDDGERRLDLVIAALLAGACTLTKVPGLVVGVVLVLLILHRGRIGPALLASAVAGAVSSLLLIYAAVIDWDLFWYVTRDQATIRNSVWQEFVPFFFDTLVNHNRVGRAWLIFLWIAFVAAALPRGRRGTVELVLPAVGYLVAMGLASGGWHYGWYLLPVQPLLCLGAGRFLADLWEKPDLLRGALLVLLPVMYGLGFVVSPEWVGQGGNVDFTRRAVAAFVIAFLAPFGLATVFRAPSTVVLARVAASVAVALFVALNAFFVVRYEVLYESHASFDDATLCDRCEERREPPPAAPVISPAAARAPEGSASSRSIRKPPVPPSGETRAR